MIHSLTSTAFLRPIPAAPLSRELSDRLRLAIVRGEFAADDRLSELDLCAAFDVSRTPLREALNKLISEGLIVREPNRGVRVAQIDRRTASDFYDCRILIETTAITLAAPHLGSAELEIMSGVLERLLALEQLPPAPESRWEWLSLVDDFHNAHRSACPNRELVGLIDALSARAMRLRVINMNRAGRMSYSLACHRGIYDALASADAAGAAAHLRDLLETSRLGLLAALDEHPEIGAAQELTV